MPHVVEYLLYDALFDGNSLALLSIGRDGQTNAAATRGQGKPWVPYALPDWSAAQRWLLGATLDADLTGTLDRFFSRQFLFGARAKHIRALFMSHDIPQHTSILPVETDTARRVVQHVAEEWGRLPTTTLALQIARLDEEMVRAAFLLKAYREGDRNLDSTTWFKHITALMRVSPRLFDYWLSAADHIR